MADSLETSVVTTDLVTTSPSQGISLFLETSLDTATLDTLSPSMNDRFPRIYLAAVASYAHIPTMRRLDADDLAGAVPAGMGQVGSIQIWT